MDENRGHIYITKNKLADKMVRINIWAMCTFVVGLSLIPWCIIAYQYSLGQLMEEHFRYAIEL